jgi:bacteriocin-like protein
MRKKAPKHKSKPTDTLLKTSKKKDIELTEKELRKVTGGGKVTGGFAKLGDIKGESID